MHLGDYKWLKLKSDDKAIMAYSGSMRGAIAFGLSHSIITDNTHNKDIIITTTLTLVFITTVGLGALMPLAVKKSREWFGESEAAEQNLKHMETANMATYSLMNESPKKRVEFEDNMKQDDNNLLMDLFEHPNLTNE